MARRALTLVIALALVAAAGLALWQKHRADEAEMRAGLDAGRVLSAVFTRETRLVVARLRGEAVATSRSSSYFFVNVQQATKAPFEIEYYLDFSKLRPSDYHWNADEKIMTVDAPAIAVSKPNIDWTQAKVRQSGFWISRGAGISLQQGAALILRDQVNQKAASPEHMAQAQAASAAAIRQVLETPLRVAGEDGIRIAVRLPGENKPASLSDEQWDRSRSWEDVLRSLH